MTGFTLALIAKEEKPLDEAREFVLTAMGTSGMDETTMGPGPELMGNALYRGGVLRVSSTRRHWKAAFA